MSGLLNTLLGLGRGTTVPGFAGGQFNTQSPMQPVGTPVDADADALDEDVTVQGWKPKKRTFLGFLGDVASIHGGGRAVFAEAKQRENMQRALEGWQVDPEGTLTKLRKVNPELAFRLENQYKDNQRAEGIAKRQEEVARFAMEEKVRNRVAAALAATRNNPNAYGPMRERMLRYANRYGVDLSADLPEQYDEGAIEALRYGGMTVDQQFDNERTERYQNERLEDFDASREQQGALGRARVNATLENQRVRSAATIERERIRAASRGKGKESEEPAVGTVQVNTKRKQMRTYQGNGKWKVEPLPGNSATVFIGSPR